MGLEDVIDATNDIGTADAIVAQFRNEAEPMDPWCRQISPNSYIICYEGSFFYLTTNVTKIWVSSNLS